MPRLAALTLASIFAFAPLSPAADPETQPASAPATTRADVKPVTNSIGVKLVPIPPGTFTMGTPAKEKGHLDNETQHKVTISKGFLMATTPVTQAQWKALMDNNPSFFKGDDLPVETVNWCEAVAFCEKLSKKEGKTYRLPTEAEWEYACRAGTTTRYNIGDSENDLDQAGWYRKNSDDKTHPVAQKKNNAWGLFDMHGNVLQWCSDSGANYPRDPVTDPHVDKGDEGRVTRGGAWTSLNWQCRTGFRSEEAPKARSNFIGFRLVLELP